MATAVRSTRLTTVVFQMLHWHGHAHRDESQGASTRTSWLPPSLNNRVSMVTVRLGSETLPPLGEIVKFLVRLYEPEQEVTSFSEESTMIHIIYVNQIVTLLLIHPLLTCETSHSLQSYAYG